MRSTLPTELISVHGVGGGGGGGGWIWRFVDTFGFLSLHWNFVRTPTKDIIVPTKYLNVIYQQNMEKNCVFPTQNYETFGYLGSNAFFFFFFFFRDSGSSVSSLRNKSTKTRTYCTDKICYFTNKILLTDWEELLCFRRKSTKISARSQSLNGFSGRNKSSWTRTYHECYEHKDIYQQNNKKNRMFQSRTQKYKLFFSLAIIYNIFLSFCCYCTDKNMLFTNITMRRIACFLRESNNNNNILFLYSAFHNCSYINALYK